MTFNTMTLGIPNGYLENTTLIRSKLPPGSYKTSLDTSPPPKLISKHYKQFKKITNEFDGQPSRLLASVHFPNYRTL